MSDDYLRGFPPNLTARIAMLPEDIGRTYATLARRFIPEQMAEAERDAKADQEMDAFFESLPKKIAEGLRRREAERRGETGR